MTTAIALREDFTREQVELIKRTICNGASDDELALFTNTSRRLQLDPFARQIFAVFRWNKKLNRNVMQIQVSVDGFRVVAERNGHYAGQLGPFWSSDGKNWHEVWLEKDPPRAAKVAVLRDDFKEPLWAVATWDQYKQEGQYGLSEMWKKMGPLMLGKCAECLALRRAFPNELSEVYSPEEMAQAANGNADGADYIPPTKEGPRSEAPKATTGMTLTSTDGAAPNGATKRQTAADIAYCGEPLSPAQLKKIHALRSEVGGVFSGNEEDARTNWGKALRVYRSKDGERITSSKDLCKTQAAHLIDRMEGYVRKQAEKVVRMEQETKPVDDVPLEDLLVKAFTHPEHEAEWFMMLFGKDSGALDERDLQSAKLLLEAGLDTPAYTKLIGTMKATGRVL